MLYRKYRSQTFTDVVGQEHVVKTLRGALSTDRIGHAYLFCGPRGTGKTTIARLLAKALNCSDFVSSKTGTTKSRVLDSSAKSERFRKNRDKNIPCNKCDNCLAVNQNKSLDLIEIDAASNRGIDEIRSLKESALVSAPSGGYKIFIVDEVHMLTKDAFNALLKILEEPPDYVVFILATTEPHKILPTVLSRVQRFDFKRLTQSEIAGKLRTISDKEKIKISTEGLTAIAQAADGALRDGEVALSKVMASYSGKDAISAEDIYSILGLVPLHYHPEFMGYIIDNDKGAAIDFINKAYSSGVDLNNFTKGFIEYLRKILMHTINPAVLASVGEELLDQDKKVLAAHSQVLTPEQLIRIMNTFVSAKESIKTSPIPQLPLELAVLELTS